MLARVGSMDVDQTEDPMMTIGTGDTPAAIGTLIGRIMMEDVGDITAPVDLTAMITGVVAIGTGIATEPGAGAAVNAISVERQQNFK